MWLFVIGAALGGSELNFGYEQTFSRLEARRGVRMTGGVGVTPSLAVGFTWAVHPLFRSQWSHDGREGLDDRLFDASPVVARGLAWGRLAPIRSERGAWRTDLGLEVGIGAVYTVDDLRALQAEDEPAALDSEKEWSPAASLAISSTVWRGSAGLRVRLERTAYAETVLGDTVYDASVTWLGVDIVVGWYE